MRIPLPQRHWTPSYLYRRVMVEAYQRSHPDAPWLTTAMIEFLEGWLKPTDTVVEFGSGRSTLWFARRVAAVTSLEHEPSWHREIQRRIGEAALTNVIHLFEPDPEKYAAVAGQNLGRVDLILVDGLNRDAAALWALEHVKPGGLIVVDNANWYLPHRTESPTSVGEGGAPATQRWEQFWRAVRAWRFSWTTNGVSDTAAFFAPCEG